MDYSRPMAEPFKKNLISKVQDSSVRHADLDKLIREIKEENGQAKQC